jgi:hypothetical protein
LGTEGQSKTTTCASPDEAIAESSKLIREKMKKGYQESGAAEKNWRPPVTYSVGEHPDHFMNFAVARFNPDVDDGEADDDDGIRTYPTLRDSWQLRRGRLATGSVSGLDGGPEGAATQGTDHRQLVWRGLR